jgi:restriction system protein
MKVSTAREELLDKALQIDHEQFEQLCKMVIERAEPTRELDLTPFRGDGGIDIHAVIDRALNSERAS